MTSMYYIGLDVHKKTISYCVKDGGGRIYAEGTIAATRWELDRWMKTLPQPWTAAMEATIFTGWIYDHLKPHAAALKADLTAPTEPREAVATVEAKAVTADPVEDAIPGHIVPPDNGGDEPSTTVPEDDVAY